MLMSRAWGSSLKNFIALKFEWKLHTCQSASDKPPLFAFTAFRQTPTGCPRPGAGTVCPAPQATTAWLPLSARPHTYMLPWCIHTHKDTNDRWVNTTHFTPTHRSEESDNYWKKKERRFVYLFINPFVHQCLLVSFFSLTWYPSCRSLHLFSLCKWLVNITSLILSDLLKTWAMESLCRLCLLCEHWEVLQCHKLYSKKFRTKTFFWEKWEDGHCEYMYGGEEGEEWEMEGGRERHRWEWLSGSRWVT